MIGKQKEIKHVAAPTYILKRDDKQGLVTHIVSVTGVLDSQNDIIHAGAYTKTISEGNVRRRVRLLDSHRTSSATDVIGSPVELREIGRDDLPADLLADFPEATGALVAVSRYNLNTQRGHDIYQLVAAGDIKEYSVGIFLHDVDFSDVKMADGETLRVRNIRTAQLVEYSSVIWGANPATQTLDVKQDDGAALSLDRMIPKAQRLGEGSQSVPDDHSAAAASQDAPTPSPESCDDTDQALTSEALRVAAHSLESKQGDVPAARRLEKTLAQILTLRQIKSLALVDRDQQIRIAFYSAFRDDPEHDYWVANVYDSFLTVFDAFDRTVGRHFAVDYDTDGTVVQFADPSQWRSGRYAFVEDSASAAPPPAQDLSLAEAAPTLSRTSVSTELDNRRQAGLQRLASVRTLIAKEHSL